MAARARKETPNEATVLQKPTGVQVRVHSITSHGPNIKYFEVVDPSGGELPPFEPGSHIDVSVPGGNMGMRQYSLCGDPQDRSHYLLSVQREEKGRGGSKAIFEQLNVGSEITISILATILRYAPALAAISCWPAA